MIKVSMPTTQETRRYMEEMKQGNKRKGWVGLLGVKMGNWGRYPSWGDRGGLSGKAVFTKRKNNTRLHVHQQRFKCPVGLLKLLPGPHVHFLVKSTLKKNPAKSAWPKSNPPHLLYWTTLLNLPCSSSPPPFLQETSDYLACLQQESH